MLVDGKMRSKEASTNLPLRGVSALAPQVRRNFKIVEGRMFREGTNEVVVGAGAAEGARTPNRT